MYSKQKVLIACKTNKNMNNIKYKYGTSTQLKNEKFYGFIEANGTLQLGDSIPLISHCAGVNDQLK